MKQKFTVTTIFSMLLWIFIPSVRQAIPQTSVKVSPSPDVKKATSEQAKFALLVGINEYPEPIKDLNGCENDVKLMRETLSEIYGFNTKTEIKELLSSSSNAADKPTRQMILDGFDKHLIVNAKEYLKSKGLQPKKDAAKGATIIFYYSGHGSNLLDNENKDEPDGKDETIVPMDSDLAGSKDIRDDEFDSRFAELKDYTTNITFIFDSCHSGTITRGVGERSLNRDLDGEIAKRDGTDTALDENMDSAGESYVTISGSLPNEKAQETWLPNLKTKKDEMNGYLTYFLVQTLREMPGASYQEIMKRVKAAVQKRNSDQHPQIEGDVDRPVFGAAISGNKKAVDVLTVKKDGEDSILTINAGKIVGAYPGGAVAIYKKAGDADHLALGEITEPTDDFTATVKVRKTVVPENAKAVLANPFFGINKRIVALDLKPKPNISEKNDTGLQMIKRLAENLKESDYIKPVTMLNPLFEKSKSWNIAIVRSTYGEFKKGNRQPVIKNVAVPKDDDEIYYLASINGKPIYNFFIEVDKEGAEDEIQNALEKFVRVDNLRTIGNENSDMNKGLQLKIIKLKSAEKPPVGSVNCAIVEDGILQNSLLNPGEWFVMEITNNTGEPLFPYLYNISAGGAVKLLYEPKAEGDILKNTNTVRTWGTRKCAVFRSTAPFGTETFKIIAASKMFNGRILESPSIARLRSKGFNPLDEIFALASTNTRDVETVTFEFSGWATASLDIEIKEK